MKSQEKKPKKPQTTKQNNPKLEKQEVKKCDLRKIQTLTDKNPSWLGLTLTMLTHPRETEHIQTHEKVTHPSWYGTAPVAHQLQWLAAACVRPPTREEPDARQDAFLDR